MWCDDFDMDLYAVLPDAVPILAPVAGLRLYTTGGLTDGALNGPTVWWTDYGLTAFFGLLPDGAPLPAKGPQPPAYQPPAYVTDRPVVACTAEEAIRDLWVHQGAMVVAGRVVWEPRKLYGSFQTIMSSIRGWREIDTHVDRAIVLNSLVDCVHRLKSIASEVRVEE